MSEARAAPYGSWASPITSDLIASATIRLGELALDGDDVYWIESRPAEGGRSVDRAPDAGRADRRPDPGAVQRPHARPRVRRRRPSRSRTGPSTSRTSPTSGSTASGPGEAPAAVTPEGPWRYADGVVDRRRNRLICVREDHSAEGREAVNSDRGGRPGDRRAQRAGLAGRLLLDPRLSPDGRGSPGWPGTTRTCPGTAASSGSASSSEDGSVGYQERVAGGPSRVDLPARVVAGRRAALRLRPHRLVEPLPLAPRRGRAALAERGRVRAAAVGLRDARPTASSRPTSIVCTYVERGVSRLASLDTATGQHSADRDAVHRHLGHPRAGRPGGPAWPARRPRPARSCCSTWPAGRTEVLRRSSSLRIDPAYLSIAGADRVPDRGRADRARLLLPAAQPGLRPARPASGRRCWS